MKDKNKYWPGETVRLKSGGPVLTIVRVNLEYQDHDGDTIIIHPFSYNLLYFDDQNRHSQLDYVPEMCIVPVSLPGNRKYPSAS